MRGKRIYVIAEAGVNHNGDPKLALDLVKAAAGAGADAVKFQIYSTGNLVSTSAPKAGYQLASTDQQETQHVMLRRLELSQSNFIDLHARCAQLGIEFLASPFDPASAQFLAGLGVSRLKLGSGEITNAMLLLAAARTNLPIVLSTGMSQLGEIEAALGVLAYGFLNPGRTPCSAAFIEAYESAAARRMLAEKIVLLHCTTEYPAPMQDVNLKAIDTLRSAFGLPVGYSDHTAGITIPIAAAAREAVVIEKHLTLDRTLPGPDHRASLEPAEFGRMVAGIRAVEQALGTGVKTAAPSERDNRNIARRSLIAACDISPGELFTEDNLAVLRPATGTSAMAYYDWIGKPAQRGFLKDEAILP
ncbi:MAG: N-acetylneuraminate synthase [Sterolibacterium sp.]